MLRATTYLDRILDEAHKDGVALDVQYDPKKKLAIIKLINTATSTGGMNKGFGTYYLVSLCRWADKYKIKLALSPALGMGATSRPRLLRFYKKFDFIFNNGKTVDDTHNQDMYRVPK